MIFDECPQQVIRSMPAKVIVLPSAKLIVAKRRYIHSFSPSRDW